MENNKSSFYARHQFLIYRLFSLFGLIPIGAFVIMHLSVNASILTGWQDYQNNVDRIHSLGGIIPLVEMVFIFIPLLFHAILGFVVVAGGSPNMGNYPYANNVRYTLQRVTGVIAFFFIMWHVLHMHWIGAWLTPVNPELFAVFDPHHASSTTAEALQGPFPVIMIVAYAIGVIAASYHLANGVWTAGITWGLWTSETGMRRASYISVALGLFLTFAGLGAIYGFSTADVSEIRAEETEALEEGDGKEYESQPTELVRDSQ